MLVSVIVFEYCFCIPMWMPCSPVEAQASGFAPPQPYRAYPFQAYVPHGDGLWPMPGVHQVAASSTALSRGNLMLLRQLSTSQPNSMLGHTALGYQQSYPIPLVCYIE